MFAIFVSIITSDIQHNMSEHFEIYITLFVVQL